MQRSLEWLIPAALLPVGLLLGRFGLTQGAQAGAESALPITLVASDEQDLACAMPAAVDGFACEFTELGGAKVPSGAKADGHRLAPYKTTDGRLFLVAGLFQVPGVRARVDSEHAASKASASKPKRFTANCTGRLVRQVSQFSTRWARDGGWHPGEPAWIVEPRACTTDG